ncbi:cupredoxin domain-containing protein [Natranaeroarchaeum aerophilus]|uniref:Plastocyanin/azurin family copper-binding protein n=1 Tax=Natranaeroarchaeum aerophilus TaxID=2917711 RepID=A0AAE3K806_9EURY|nr:plastocyanin/azurin family copper-binding protein [Natranaeroarchaeum aerophilus]MCL9814499.1 plastocyanin/azurin family copper-binding protein [Natranaeroarchaeum aerophilus]
MILSTRREVLAMLSATGIAGLAGCSGDDDGENEDQENADGGNEESPDDGDVDDTNGDGEPVELNIPEPVDWTDETQATIEVGSGGEAVFEPDAVRVETGTTLRWVWLHDGHTVSPTHLPDGGEFEGHERVEEAGFEIEFVPETPGEYRYVCEEHEEMVGYLVVE